MKQSIIMGIIIISVFVGAGVSDNIQSHYNRQGTVVERVDTLSVIEDTTGNLWEVEDENLNINDKVNMKMFTCHTDNIITDDEIVSITVL